MEKNSCFREFAKYTSLNVMGMIALSCYILADTYFVSKGLGANGLTALNLAIPIYSFIHGSGLMIGMGGATWYAIRKSQQDDASANRFLPARWPWPRPSRRCLWRWAFSFPKESPNFWARMKACLKCPGPTCRSFCCLRPPF